MSPQINQMQTEAVICLIGRCIARVAKTRVFRTYVCCIHSVCCVLCAHSNIRHGQNGLSWHHHHLGYSVDIFNKDAPTSYSDYFSRALFNPIYSSEYVLCMLFGLCVYFAMAEMRRNSQLSTRVNIL